ncbi:MAG: hypothetical protein Q8S24_02525 [Eubacteriales bacterium]|nr:hypothetical protein [Eubacteriales bacterium]
MIKNTAMLMDELKEYVNPTAKIRRLVDSGELAPVVRGLHETDADIPGYYLALIIYGPSYLSFEFALAYYSLIPEAVYNFTSATFEKKRRSNILHLMGRLPIKMYQVKNIPLVLFCILKTVMDSKLLHPRKQSAMNSTKYHH